MAESCELCGGAVEVRSTREGTNHYVAVGRGRVGEDELVKLQTKLQQAQENLRWAREQAESDSRNVQQAQEERDRSNTVSMEVMGERDEARLRQVTFQRWFEAAVKHHNDLVAERDGAIERGVRACYSLANYADHSQRLFRALGRAETAPAEQRALAEKLKPYVGHSHACSAFHFQGECNCGLAELVAPAEAQAEGS